MGVQAYLYTHPGGRAENEDSSALQVDGERGIFVVADGLGGHRGGQAASELVTGALISAWKQAQEKPWESWLVQQFSAVNEALLDGSGLGKSTVVALILQGTDAFWGSVGDSRLYCIKDGMISQISRDHSVTYKKYLAKEISRAQMNFDEDRSSLLRTLGDRDKSTPESGRLLGLAVPGTAFLLCSDGFWEYLLDEEILADALKSRTPQLWGEQMLLRLMHRIKPGSDNLTFITVFVS